MLVSASRTHNQTLLSTAHSLHTEHTQNDDPHSRPLAEMLPAPTRDASNPSEVTLARERLKLIVEEISALSEHERESLSRTLNGLRAYPGRVL